MRTRSRLALAFACFLAACVWWLTRAGTPAVDVQHVVPWDAVPPTCGLLFPWDVNVTVPDFGGRRNPQALRVPFRGQGNVPIRQRTSYALDTDSLERCAPSVEDVRQHNESCAGLAAFAVSVTEMAFDAHNPTILNVDVDVRLAAHSRPLAGLLLRGRLVCATCVPQANCKPPIPVQVFAMSYDHCDGTYSFRFEGLHGLTESQLWNMTVRFEHADFAHHMAYGRNCTRSIGSLVSNIPDGGVRSGACPRMLWFGEMTVVALAALAGPRARAKSAPSGAVSADGVRAAIDALPVCAGGQAFEGSHGRWLLRPRGPVDPGLCRSHSNSEILQLWTMDGDYVWCPYECRLQMYAESEIRQCLARKGIRRVLFVGDSRTHNLFFDMGRRLVYDVRGKEAPPFYMLFGGRPHTHFDALGAHFRIRFTWGLFEQRSPNCLPELCRYSGLNSTEYFAMRTYLESGLHAVRRVLAEGPWDVLILSEGVHMMQPFLTIDDFEVVIRSTLNAVLNAARPPRIVVFYSSPAFVDVAVSSTRDITRQDVYNKLALRIIAEMLPDAFVLDMFALTVARGRDRTWDFMHFYPGNLDWDPLKVPRTIGSEAVLMLFNMLCNDAA